ncbi:hypothetical protein RUND412_007410 [Rhizina undulata]
MSSDLALLNAILRISSTRSNFNTLVPPAPSPVEADHFFEVQHIADLLLNSHPPLINPNSWYEEHIGFFIDLASFVNEHRNLFEISRAENQTKKTIPLNSYRTDPLIRRYLAYQVRDRQNALVSVESQVQALARAMRDRNTPYGRLTKGVGTRLCAIMQW